MEKKADGCVRQLSTEHLGKQHQLIVMHPNQIALLVAMHDCPAENTVRFNVCLPIFGIKFQLRRKVVKHRPKGLVGVAFIESFCNLRR